MARSPEKSSDDKTKSRHSPLHDYPRRLRPMLATEATIGLLDSQDHIFEPKLDGYRALCFKNATLSLLSRNGKDLTTSFSPLDVQQLAQHLDAETCILDGEIVSYDRQGNPSFSLLQQAKGTLGYVAFDILFKDGVDLRGLPLTQRKEMLEHTIITSPLAQPTQPSQTDPGRGAPIQTIFYTKNGKELYREMIRRGLEGVIAKQQSSIYVHERSPAWKKVKIHKTVDCIILGYTSYKRSISSLALGVYRDGRVHYLGKVGTGFSERTLDMLKQQLKPLEIPNRFRSALELPKEVIPVEPSQVCEISYHGLTADEKLRISRFLRLRPDKPPHECTFDQFMLHQNN